MEKKKRIYFCLDYESFDKWHRAYRMTSFESTRDSIAHGESMIVTMSIVNMTFDLIDQGYDIYLCYKDMETKIEDNMTLPNGMGLNSYYDDLLESFLDGELDKLIGYDKVRPVRKGVKAKRVTY